MGALFELKHANIMLYLTLPGRQRPPRLRAKDLHEFLFACIEGNHGKPAFFSSDPDWAGKLVAHAEKALGAIRYSEEKLSDEVVRNSLVSIRECVSNYSFYTLVVGNENLEDETSSMARSLAFESGGRALVMIPYPEGPNAILSIDDPYGALVPAIEKRGQWPGMLFWSQSGESAFMPIRRCYELGRALLESDPDRTGELIASSNQSGSTSVRLLHLSDLHFGTKTALRNQALLKASIDSELGDADHVVISGDLFDNPREDDFLLFNAFRADLHRRTGSEPIVIPGNHDQRWMGNLPGKLRQVADLEWSSFEVRDESKTVFFCFDSARSGAFARGCVDKPQLVQMGTAFETHKAANPNIAEYLRVALVHHHPFSFSTGQETWVQRTLGRMGFNDELFLAMDEAESFVAWLLRRRIPLVLHGHKHVQRHVEHDVFIDGSRRRLTSIGCGTSLGAEGFPLSYNVLSWDSAGQSWSVTFFADHGDGSGFERQRIVAHRLE